MKLLVGFFLLLISQSVLAIVGGSRISIESLPATRIEHSVVRIIMGFPKCTGTVIAPHYIVTAGHCFYDVDNGDTPDRNSLNDRLRQTKVYYDIDDFTGINLEDNEFAKAHQLSVKRIFIHPRWLSGDSNHDIALIETNEPAPVSPARLMPISAISPFGKQGSSLSVGYGRFVDDINARMAGTIDGVLKEFTPRNVQPITAGELQKMAAHGLKKNEFSQLLQSDASKESICDGDSGGPLFMSFKRSQNDWFLVAIADSTIGLGDCAGKGLIDGFISISTNRNWIDSVLNSQQ